MLASSILFFSSCAHRNLYNHAACTETYGPFNTFGYQIIGAVFQQGECSFYRPIKVEFGEIYTSQKKKLLFAVDSGGGSEIDEFAKILRCEKEVIPVFKKNLLINKSHIFGENYEKDSRDVMLNIYGMIRKDENLKSCDYN